MAGNARESIEQYFDRVLSPPELAGLEANLFVDRELRRELLFAAAGEFAMREACLRSAGTTGSLDDEVAAVRVRRWPVAHEHDRKRVFGSNAAFTLVELLVVIAIISVLAAMLMPALGKVMRTARSISCTSNLKQVGTAVEMYVGENRSWLPHSGDNNLSGVSTPNLPWRFQIAPYLEIMNPTQASLEHGIFQCASQSIKTCGTSSYGDNGFYGGYGWNFMYMGWRNVVSNGFAPYVKRSQLKHQAYSIVASDTTDDTSAATYVPFFVYPWNWRQPTRHRKGGNFLFADVHVVYFTNEFISNHCGGSDNWFDCK